MLLCPGFFQTSAEAASLKGSASSVARQNEAARAHDFSYLRTPAKVRAFAELGLLIKVRESRHLELSGVSFPYARPEVKLFIDRLAAQYHAATGERLVVTSLTRPQSHQPRNASQESVHPCGMAVDIRRSSSKKARRWIEDVLLSLEDRGVIEATRERRPPHYHVAVFPRPYAAYVKSRTGGEATLATYRVRSGDSLWGIARRHGTDVSTLKQINRLRSTRIIPGQKIKVPPTR